MQQLVKELRISEHVHFLGEQDNLQSILASADLLLLPSETESFGLVALEAMSCRVPVVGTRVGGLPEVVTHGESGFLAPVGEIREMADAATSLLTDPERHERFATSARERAVSAFDGNLIIPQYEALYERLL